jgi:hypothetical protein
MKTGELGEKINKKNEESYNNRMLRIPEKTINSD